MDTRHAGWANPEVSGYDFVLKPGSSLENDLPLLLAALIPHFHKITRKLCRALDETVPRALIGQLTYFDTMSFLPAKIRQVIAKESETMLRVIFASLRGQIKTALQN